MAAEGSLLQLLPEETRDRIVTGAERVRLRGGEWLFRAGDPADAFYLVSLGRLEVLSDADPPERIRVLERGASVGELAVLGSTERSASIRAMRDTELLRVDAGEFTRLVDGEPGFAAAVSRALATQLARSRAADAEPAPRPGLISIVALDDAVDVEGFVRELHPAIAGCSDAALCRAPEEGTEFLDLLDRVERDSEQTLIVGGRADEATDEWTQFALRQADRVVALTSGGRPPDWLRSATGIHGCDLVLDRSTQPSDLYPWWEAASARAVHVLANDGAIDRLARRLAGRSLGVVLSGGGARGFAHIGVLQELESAGVEVDRVGGCSIGAFVGALYARGLDPRAINELMHREFIEHNPLNDYTIPLVALLRGQRGRDLVERVFGPTQIEELPREYYCVACDLISSALVEHRRGPLFVAVGSSMALPGIAPPIPEGDCLYVDGGVLNNLPVAQMATRSEGPVLAIDITAKSEPPKLGGARIRTGRVMERVLGVGAFSPLRSTEIMMRTVTLGSVDTAAAAAEHADLTITPQLAGIGLLDWAGADRSLEAGRDAGRRALEEHADLFASWTS